MANIAQYLSNIINTPAYNEGAQSIHRMVNICSLPAVTVPMV
jgi:hypothetical protein